MHAEALFRSWIYASASEFRSARQQISARLATYHQPADGIGNSSLRRMLVQCRDELGSGLGFKLSYPDDALSLARDSEKEGKTTAHGNVAALAQLAEDARIDFRVLVLTRDLASAARSRMQPNATAAAIFAAAADHASRHAHRDAEVARSHPELTSEARRWHAELRWPASGGLRRRPVESQARILADEECILAAQLRALDGAFWRTVPYESLVAQPRQQAAAIARFVRVPAVALAQSFERRVRASGRAPPTAEERAFAASLRSSSCDPKALARDAVYGWEISQESESEGRRLETSSAASTSRLPSYASLYPARRTPAAQLLSAVEDADGVLWRDVESVGLSRLAAARANPTTRDLVIVSTDRKHLDIAVNCVANLANVGIREYIVLADSAKTCEALRGRLACVWSTLLTPFSEKLKQGATGPAHLWLSRQIYAGRLAELGYNPMVLDSDSALFANPLALVAAHLPEYAFVALADHSGTWSSLNCGTYYLRNARRGGPLLAAWRNFERRVFAILNTSAPLPVSTTSCGGPHGCQPERLLLWENTLLDWTFAGAVVGDPAFIGRGRTNDSRVLTRTEKAWMRWSPLKATEPPPARFSTPGGAYAAEYTLRTLVFGARPGAELPEAERERALQAPPWLFSAESDKEVKGNGASYWHTHPPPTALVHLVCCCTGAGGRDQRRIALRLLGRWMAADVAWVLGFAAGASLVPQPMIAFRAPVPLRHLEPFELRRTPPHTDRQGRVVRGRITDANVSAQLDVVRSLHDLLFWLAWRSGRRAALPLFECTGRLAGRHGWTLHAAGDAPRPSGRRLAVRGSGRTAGGRGRGARGVATTGNSVACMHRLDLKECFKRLAFPEDVALTPPQDVAQTALRASHLGGNALPRAVAAPGAATAPLLLVDVEPLVRALTAEQLIQTIRATIDQGSGRRSGRPGGARGRGPWRPLRGSEGEKAAQAICDTAISVSSSPFSC